MGTVKIDNAKFEEILLRLNQNLQDPQAQADLMKVIEPAVKITVDRWGRHSNDDEDMAQRLRGEVWRKVPYFVTQLGTVKNWGHYLMTCCRFASMAFSIRRTNYRAKFVLMSDLKFEGDKPPEPAYDPDVAADCPGEQLDLNAIRRVVGKHIRRAYRNNAYDRSKAQHALEKMLAGKTIMDKRKVSERVLGIREDVQDRIHRAILRQRPDLWEKP